MSTTYLDNLPTTASKEDKIKAAIMDSLYATNRSLYMWNMPNRRGSYKLLDQAEVRGLFVNHFTKFVKVIIGYRECSALVRNGKPMVEVNMLEHYITKVKIPLSTRWCSNLTEHIEKQVNKILLEINYDEFKYNPKEAKHQDIDSVIDSLSLDSPLDINFAKIENIKF